MVIEEKRNYNKSLDDLVVITEDNILKLSKIIALSSLRKFRSYSINDSKRIDTLHKQLQQDICYHQSLDCYSDAYDLVQEASLFLLKYLHQKLGDKCIYQKTTVIDPEIISIRFACFKNLFAYLRKELKNGDTEDDEILQFIPEKVNITKEQDYLKVNTIITKLAQNDLEKEILQYLYNGVEINTIAEFLNISVWKIYKRRRLFKDRYLMYKNIK